MKAHINASKMSLDPKEYLQIKTVAVVRPISIISQIYAKFPFI
jgi:hypothetical protein